MRSRATYLITTGTCLLFILAGTFSLSINAQPVPGVIWEVPNDMSLAEEQLEKFESVGIEYIEIIHPSKEQVFPYLKNTRLTLLVRSPISFLTYSELDARRNDLSEHLMELRNSPYDSLPNLGGYGVFSHSQTNHPDFIPMVREITEPLTLTEDLYYLQTDNWYNLDNTRRPFGTSFSRFYFQKSDLITFYDHFDALIKQEGEQILFMHSTWLIEALEQYPELETALVEYSNSGQWDLPLPETSQRMISANWMVLILIFLWAGLTVQIKFLPYVRPMILRYFFAHRFFVEDIVSYRERALAGGLLQIITHAVFGGLVFFIASRLLFSELGLQSLFHHYSWLSIIGDTYYSIFLSGFLLVLITQILALSWLHLPAKNVSHLSQTLNIYTGIFYLDYVIVTLMITLFSSGSSSSVTLSMAAIFITVWYFAFNIAALDISRTNRENRGMYIFLTIGLHTLLSIIGLLVVIFYTDLISVLKLASTL